jgi:hypothetical protein
VSAPKHGVAVTRAELLKERARLRAALAEIAAICSDEGIARTQQRPGLAGSDAYPFTVGYVGSVAKNALKEPVS